MPRIYLRMTPVFKVDLGLLFSMIILSLYALNQLYCVAADGNFVPPSLS
jgi:hypothetical protein